MTSASIYGQPPELPADYESTGLARRRSSPCGSVTGRSPRRRSTYSPARGPSAGAVRRHHLAVLTVDRIDDAGHRLACQQERAIGSGSSTASSASSSAWAPSHSRMVDAAWRAVWRVRRRPTVSDEPMWRVYPSNVTRTSLAGLRRVDYARLSSSTGMVRTPAVWRSYSAKPG
jgi:hypothetical protein